MSTGKSSTYRPLALWSIPRAMSHAFEKMIRTRNDLIVFAEPFNDAWYCGPEKGTHRDMGCRPELTYENCLRPVLEESKHGRVFVRAQPWQLIDKYFNIEILSLFQSSMLIRDPAYSIPSLHLRKPDVTEFETGFIGLHKTWNILLAAGEDVPIVDAYDIQTDPVGYVGAWCDAVKLERNDNALHWQEGEVESWNNWTEYTRTVVSSTGFLPPKAPPVVKNERLAKLIDSSRRYYRELEAHKISI